MKTPLLNGTQVGVTSMNRINKWTYSGPLCETEPDWNLEAYNFMRGFKKDGTPWVVPNTNPPQITKFTYSGDPETNTGWTQFTGSVQNCGGSLTGTYVPVDTPGEFRFLMSTGSENLNVNPGESNTIVMAQAIARGGNNLNSVTKLKSLSDTAYYFYLNYILPDTNKIIINIPDNYYFFQNYPNPFNPSTTIKYGIPKDGFVTIKIYDIAGREILKLVNEFKPAGFYSVNFNGSGIASGIYFYQIKVNDFYTAKKMLLIK
jgi:hypothetical protein